MYDGTTVNQNLSVKLPILTMNVPFNLALSTVWYNRVYMFMFHPSIPPYIQLYENE